MSRIEQALAKAALSRNDHISPGAEKTAGGSSPANHKVDKFLDVAPSSAAKNPMLAAMRGNFDIASEEYNKLRSLVVELSQGEQFNNVLMVCSTISEEGKSLTALNLAIAIAKSYDHTVLLVDTDLRRPSLHKFLGIEPKVGLIQCLRDDVPISQALVKTGIGKLVLLPAGGTVTHPVEMLSSKRMKEVVSELKNRYPERFVIFDTPPVLPFADAQVLAPAVDGVIFVVREGRADVSDIKKAIHTLHETNMLGIVYNDVHRITKNKYQYNYYN